MNSIVLSKTYTEPPFCEKEVLRYAGCKAADNEISALLQECADEAKDKLTYKVCYSAFPVTTDDAVCDFESFRFRSHDLAAILNGCKKVIVFAATVGIEIDRLIAKYGRLSPSKALIFQAIGAERVEALCDAFCADIANEMNAELKPRFSPGYGDLPLDAQKDIFAILGCEKRIGLTLGNSLLMSPSKSVTAIVGIGSEEKRIKNKCSACNIRNCTFRGTL